MKKLIFLLLVVFQLFTIIYLYKNLQNKKRVIDLNVSSIKKENIVAGISTENNLIHFYEPKPSQVIVSDEDWLSSPVKQTINSDSLNERFEYQPEKQDVFRIVTLGDSFTYGEYINTSDNYPEQLEIKLESCPTKIEVINLGVGGYDIQYSAERYKKRGTKYNPDLVMWLINSWNFLNNNELLMEKADEIYGESTISGKLKNVLQKDIKYSAWTQAINELLENIGKEKLLEIQTNYFRGFRKNIYSGKLLVLYFPDQINEKSLTSGFDKFIETIKQNDSNITLLPIMPYNTLETLKADHHPNANDYKKIARFLSDYLLEQKIIKCD